MRVRAEMHRELKPPTSLKITTCHQAHQFGDAKMPTRFWELVIACFQGILDISSPLKS